MVDNGVTANNFRSPVLVEPTLITPTGLSGGGIGTVADGSGPQLRTPFAGNVRALPPPLPQTPYAASYGIGAAGSSGLGGFANYNSYNNFGGGYGSYSGYGGLGSFGGYGGFGGSYNRFGMAGAGMNLIDPEMRFIQMAEASSRPAFQSIESLVSAFGNIAAMLDSTFFALTSSFRAILGVAANFGRLRGVFAQFWQTFAIFRGLTWIYKKILYWLRLSNIDPSSEKFQQAFAEAVNDTTIKSGAPKLPPKGQSPWPVLAFISFIFTAPYLIMKLLGTVANTAQEEARNPVKWVNPIETRALFDFQARNSSELSLHANQLLLIAPKEIQNTLGLLNTGWAFASTMDHQAIGIIPINYVKSPQQLRDERQQNFEEKNRLLYDAGQGVERKIGDGPQPALMNLSPASFPAPSTTQKQQHSQNVDVGMSVSENAPQPLSPSSAAAMITTSGTKEIR